MKSSSRDWIANENTISVLFIGHENEEIRQAGAIQASFLEDAEIAQFRR